MRLTGIVPIVPTPFLPDDTIDIGSLDRLIDFCSASGAVAVGLPAWGSEFYKLSESERLTVIGAAVKRSARRIPVVAQCNHVSARHAADLAGKAQELGADVIAIALPRIFPYSEQRLLAFAQAVASSVRLPVLIQDWNPGGATVSAAWVAELHRRCPNFQYIKLEEPSMGPKVRDIRSATSDKVGVLEGWGGLYVLELTPSGICGLMPDVGVLDVMVKVFDMARRGEMDDAYRHFNVLLPFLVYCMQNMEHFHHVEKRLLVRRGLIRHDHVRELTVDIDPDGGRYLDLLIDKLCTGIESLGMKFQID